jgi:hypothetical protein
MATSQMVDIITGPSSAPCAPGWLPVDDLPALQQYLPLQQHLALDGELDLRQQGHLQHCLQQCLLQLLPAAASAGCRQPSMQQGLPVLEAALPTPLGRSTGFDAAAAAAALLQQQEVVEGWVLCWAAGLQEVVEGWVLCWAAGLQGFQKLLSLQTCLC